MPDYDGMTLRQLVAARRAMVDGLRTQLDGLWLPEQQEEARRRFAEDVKPIDAAIAERQARIEAENRWLKRAAENPVAADLMLLLAEAKSDEDLFTIASNIAGRFERAAQPAPQPEPELADAVPAIDANRPLQFQPEPYETAAARRERIDRYQRQEAALKRHDLPDGSTVAFAGDDVADEHLSTPARGVRGTTTLAQRWDAIRRRLTRGG